MSGPTTSSEPASPLVGPAIRALRTAQTDGFSRRTLMRRALGAGVGLVTLEWLGGTLGFAWSAVAASTPIVRIGTLGDLIAASPGLPIAEGFPAYVPAARAFVVLIDPSVGRRLPGEHPTGEGLAPMFGPVAGLPTSGLDAICASRTSGFTAHATSRAMTGSASRRPANCTAPLREGWTGLRSRSTAMGS